MGHTPGPWTQDGLTIKTTRGIIAECPTPQHGGTFDCQANARLIAAAPALLEALTRLKQAFDITSHYFKVVEVDGEILEILALKEEVAHALALAADKETDR